MSSGSIAFNPYVTTVARGTFQTTSEGFVQGEYQDDPSLRYELAGGTYLGAAKSTTPIWGGVAITEGIRDGAGGAGTVPAIDALGGIVDYATTVTAASSANASLGQITGFAVFNQAYHGITTPQSPVPTYGTGASVNFLRLGSGMRLAVAMDPVLVDATGSLITSYFSWDFNNQVLQPYDASTATYAITSMTWCATVANGGPGFTVVAAVATLVGAVGDIVNISGATGNTSANGSFYVTSFTDNQHFVISAPYSVTGSVTGSPVINAGTGILPVRVLSFNVGNSMTVEWDSVNQVATWNRNGSTAIILL